MIKTIFAADIRSVFRAAESDAIRIEMLRAEAARCTDPAKKQEYLGMIGFYSGSAAIGNSSQAEPIVKADVVSEDSEGTWKCEYCGAENTGKFCEDCGVKKPEAAEKGWKCFCGTVNTGKFCQNCGTEKFDLGDIECSKCSWTVEDEAEPPSICPNCGKRFTSDDIR